MKVLRSVDLPLHEQIAMEGYANHYIRNTSINLGDPARLIEKFLEGDIRTACMLFDMQKPDPTLVPKRRAA